MRGRSTHTGPVLAWGLWSVTMIGLAAPLWFGHLLRQAGRPDLAGVPADDIARPTWAH
jgi:hypothetical protein